MNGNFVFKKIICDHFSSSIQKLAVCIERVIHQLQWSEFGLMTFHSENFPYMEFCITSHQRISLPIVISSIQMSQSISYEQSNESIKFQLYLALKCFFHSNHRNTLSVFMAMVFSNKIYIEIE